MMESNPVALVTGGSRGIGRAIALRLAQAGYDLCIASLEPDDLQVVAFEINEIGRRALPLLIDIRQESLVQQMVRKTQAEFGPIDVLVNNAGCIGPIGPLQDVDQEEWNQVLAVNLMGPFLCCKAALPTMIERRSGKIINISSTSGRKPAPLFSAYAASKSGLLGLTVTLAKEVAEHNITVNAICPGQVAGDWTRRIIQSLAQRQQRTEEEIETEMKKEAALGRFVRESDIAETVAFLVSSAGENITGQAIDVSAGYYL